MYKFNFYYYYYFFNNGCHKTLNYVLRNLKCEFD